MYWLNCYFTFMLLVVVVVFGFNSGCRVMPFHGDGDRFYTRRCSLLFLRTHNDVRGIFTTLGGSSVRPSPSFSFRPPAAIFFPRHRYMNPMLRRHGREARLGKRQKWSTYCTHPFRHVSSQLWILVAALSGPSSFFGGAWDEVCSSLACRA